MQLALGLDLGTTTLSAVAVSEDGRLVARLNRTHSAHVVGLPPGRAEQNPHVLWADALQLLRELSERAPGNPMCLGVTGQMHGGLLVDARRQPLTNLITWQDRRATEAAADGRCTLLEEFRARCGGVSSEAVMRTGCAPSPGYLAVTLLALARLGELPSGACRATLVADWIAAGLCDADIVTDPSNAASTGVFDVARGAWSDELIRAAGLDAHLFPPVVGSGDVMGLIAPEVAAQTGLPAGMPVCCAVGDNQAAVLGSVPAGDPAIQINIGTGGQINWPVAEFTRVEGMDTRPLPRGRFMLVGAGLSGGDAYAWVMRTARGWLEAFHAFPLQKGGQGGSGKSLETPPDDDALFERLNALATAVPADCDGLVCEPLFRGTRRQPLAHGSFAGVTPDNFTPGHVARAVLNGIARGMKWFYEHAGPAQPAQLRRIIGSGNALRRNPLLAQTLADTFQREVWIAEHEEEAAYGAALLAGSATGVWPDLAAAGSHIRLRRASAP